MTEMNDCPHDHIERGGFEEPPWQCAKCHAEFVPKDALLGAVDVAGGVAADMLWRFHEKAMEKYGEGIDLMNSKKPRTYRPGDGHIHQYTPDMKACVLCQSPPPFLGA